MHKILKTLLKLCEYEIRYLIDNIRFMKDIITICKKNGIEKYRFDSIGGAICADIVCKTRAQIKKFRHIKKNALCNVVDTYILPEKGQNK